ncbi:MAG: hypothetical protein K5799_15155, partial [Erythrobacter sp.]|nr:hypothetical protein [Erythrobacter sp.]
RQLEQSSVIPGTGGDIWRVLWEAARVYAETLVHPGTRYPETTAPCVLCQQALDGEAQQRFARFDEFVSSEATANLERADAAIGDFRRSFEGLQIATDGDMEVIAEVAELEPTLGQLLSELVARLQAARAGVVSSLEAALWTPLAAVEEARVADVAVLAQRLLDEANAMEAVAEEREETRRRLAELRTREWVAGHLPAINARIAWLSRRQHYQAAIAETDTSAITREGSRLAERWATQELADAFSAELDSLTSGQVRVALRRAGGARGVAHHRLELDGVQRRGIALADVVSEGEHRAIALAAFFAEVGAAGSSGVVADDPTSSLDHRFRRRIARRFVRIARDRQVIVFTHDIVFLHELSHEAVVQGVQLAARQLSREGDHAGISEDGLPWHAQRITERLTALTDDLPNLRVLHNNVRPEYEIEARRLYGRLRQAWERAVEEVLLNEAITRFSPAIQTQRLRRVVDVTEEDLTAVDAGMTKCSAWLEGHDQPATANEALPDPDEIDADIRALRTWVQSIRRRRGG